MRALGSARGRLVGAAATWVAAWARAACSALTARSLRARAGARPARCRTASRAHRRPPHSGRTGPSRRTREAGLRQCERPCRRRCNASRGSCLDRPPCGHQDPAVLLVRNLQRQPGRVGGLQLFGLTRQDAGQDEVAAGCHMGTQQRCQQLERAGQDVGHDQGVLALGPFGRADVQLHAVGLGVVLARRQRRGVDVDGVDLHGAVQGRADGQDAGAAAVVQHARPGPGLRGDPAQTHPRGRVGSGAEGQARVEAHHAPGLRWRLVPARHDPELGGDLDRRELALREPHPVLLGHGLDGLDVHIARPVLGQDQGDRLGRFRLTREQGLNHRALPAGLGSRHAGLAEQGVLGVGVGVGVFDGDGEGVDLHQRVADDLDIGLAADEGKFKQMTHAPYCPATRGPLSACALPSRLRGSGCWCRLR
mmetsp:Transcript_5900/g.14498  ORF Transcript_5900/g.14498 Transcript_5900/m.14498 type:complete len:421 (-) Transcript_5900:1956-3218(-)